MNKSYALLKEPFESSTVNTPQVFAFAKQFKQDVKQILEFKGCTKIQFNLGHFYITAFFTAPTGQVWYLSLSDFREPALGKQIMYRTAKNYKDYSGGTNQYIPYESLAAVPFEALSKKL